ncbi:hypothetical protein TSAR_014538 [Trichomalopsis sarcophagae]|uniref:Uncharacterized protein n=1 Tax=Trichomalopsis sarcophagae TaxID=543379 RepID=A0A232EK73_9HYME|nr:hypothetical protein TSAR_014538 [Trichomalopsis sarcophagae]
MCPLERLPISTLSLPRTYTSLFLSLYSAPNLLPPLICFPLTLLILLRCFFSSPFYLSLFSIPTLVALLFPIFFTLCPLLFYFLILHRWPFLYLFV